MCGLEPDIRDLSPENYHTKDIYGHLISFFPVNKYTLVHYHSLAIAPLPFRSPPPPSPPLPSLETMAIRVLQA